MKVKIAMFCAVLLIVACTNSEISKKQDMRAKLDEYAKITLTTDLSHLSENQQKLLTYLFEVADIMDGLFWRQAYGDKDALMNSISDESVREFVALNYGPWERLNDNKSFVESIGEKPLGANYYPSDFTKEDFESMKDTLKNNEYSIITGTKGDYKVVPYSEAFKEELTKASELLLKASAYAESASFKHYLELRAKALLSNDYFESDTAWMDMKDNQIDFVVGPIENYEDGLMGIRTAFEAYVLIKDMAWSKRLQEYSKYLPEMQKALPVDAAYKAEMPGSSNDLAAYDIVYYAGDCNAGGKTIAINLPNDVRVHKLKGTRSLQLKNSMKAKFDSILVPIAHELMDDNLIDYITFDAFFENTMFHEIAHGLGIKETINGKGSVREALKEAYTTLEEGKADILGLYLVSYLCEQGVLTNNVKNNYATFVAGMFRSIRFGAASSHGKANLIRFNYFMEKGAIAVNKEGKYVVDFENMKLAIESLTQEILMIQGDGDYEAALKMIKERAVMSKGLQASLNQVNTKGIPVDVIFEQGPQVLRLDAL